MAGKRMTPRERREYERLQERKKRHLARRRGEEKRKKNRLGDILLLLQAVVSFALAGGLFVLNVLPFKYFAGIAVVLGVLWEIGYLSQKRNVKKSTGGKIFIIIVTVILSFAAYYVTKVSGALGKVTGGTENLRLDVQVKKEPFSVYLSGIDVYGDIKQKSRSDVNIIATVNPKTRQILLVTTPRDYYVEIPGVSNGQRDKLTHAGLYGVEASMKTLGALYDTDIPFYARINFTSLIEIVDKLGGVDVYSEYEFMTGKKAGKVNQINKGMNHLNGKEALAFSRERHNLADGDNQRGKNQQALITALIRKIISPSILLKADGIIDSVSGNVETNMSQGQIQALIRMQLKEGGSWNIRSVAAKGEGARQICYSAQAKPLYVTMPDYESVEEIKALIERVENGEILEESEKAE